MYQLSCASGYQFPPQRPAGEDHDGTVYVLGLRGLGDGLAAISSNQQLSLFDPERLAQGPALSLRTAHGGVKALEVLSRAGAVVATAGDDGSVQVWDLRSGGKGLVVQFRAGNAPILSLACHGDTRAVAVGTELQNHAASIFVWDMRGSPKKLREYREVHSDDVTDLRFDPADPAMLISGSTDGLVNICDTRIADEDETVVETFNPGASVHRAGRLAEDCVYALSHDERFVVYSTASPAEAGGGATQFGDLREGLGCRYVADVAPKVDGSGAVVGVGSQDRESFELVFLARANPWSFDLENKVGLRGAHGGEVVRSFCLLDNEQVVFSAGEDGKIKAWTPDTK